MGIFSSSPKTKTAAHPGGGEVVRRMIATAVPAGAGWMAARARGMEGAQIWPSFAFDFVLSCAEFKPLGEHLETYARYHNLPTDQARELEHFASGMQASGLLVTQAEMLRRARDAVVGAGRTGEPARIEDIGVPSGGDAVRLRRVVTSFAGNCREYGRTARFTIASNGSSGLAPLVPTLERECGVEIALFENARRAAFAAALARQASVEPEVTAFALGDPLGCGFAAGANRNALLLLRAGKPWLSLDDDTVCETSPASTGRSAGLALFASRDAFQRWFHPDYARVFERVRTEPCDYLALHESMLGRSVRSLLDQHEQVEFTSTSDEMLRRLTEEDGRIAATFTGHFGHPGIPTSHYYLSYRGRTLERLTREGEATYRQYLGSGAVRALAPCMAIADASLSPGMAIGIDSRGLVPPFPPVMHAEDFVWGAAVWQCRADAFAGHLPVALRHDPGPGRGILAPGSGSEGRATAMWEFAHILRGLMLSWSPWEEVSDPAARMHFFGRSLCEYAGEQGEFDERLRGFVLNHESEKIGYLEQCLIEEADAPDYWRGDVEAYIERTRMALTEPDFEIPWDMRGRWPAAEARVLMRGMVLGYGRLLQAWPALLAAAEGLDPAAYC